MKNFHFGESGRYGEYLGDHGVMHQKGNDYPLINPRRQLISLTILFALKYQNFQKIENSLSLSQETMSMNKNTSAAGKASNPPPLSLVDYSNDEEQTTPQGSQTSQSISDVFSTAAENLNTESDAESDPAEPHIED